MRAWWELYKKELYSIGFLITVALLLIIGWELFLFYKMDTWGQEMSFGLSFLPLSFLPLLILWLGYNAYRQEWKDDTSYFILSIPRRGWEISLAKLVSAMSFYIAATLVTYLLIYTFNKGYIYTFFIDEAPAGFAIGSFLKEIIIKSTLVYWVSALIVYIITQFSQLISLYFDRFRGLITIIVFVLSHYVIFRAATILSPLFNWLPDFPVRSYQMKMGLFHEFTFYLGSGPIIASSVLVIALFFLGSWLVEKQLEV